MGKGGGGRVSVATRKRKEKNINCTARQTPKKLLTNERIRGGGGEVAKQSKEKEQSGWDGRAIVSWKR